MKRFIMITLIIFVLIPFSAFCEGENEAVTQEQERFTFSQITQLNADMVLAVTITSVENDTFLEGLQPVPSPIPQTVIQEVAPVKAQTNAPTLTPPETNNFSDVSDFPWAVEAINLFYSLGIVEGNGDGTFNPKEYLTREQFAKILAMLFKTNLSVDDEQTFSDVNKDMWSYKYIEGAKQYLTGYYPYGMQPFFNPQGKATREDIAVALVKAINLDVLGLKDENILEKKFKDGNMVSPALRPYVALAVEHNLIQGYDGYLKPHNSITRAEAVVLLYRTLKSPVILAAPTPIQLPVPTPKIEVIVPDAKHHALKSDKPLYFKAKDYTSLASPYSGYVELDWSMPDNTASFNAVFKVEENNQTLAFEITLKKVDAIYSDGFNGYFEIKRNGSVIESSLYAKVYGLNNKIGDYFKFYCEKEAWHFSAYITEKNEW